MAVIRNKNFFLFDIIQYSDKKYGCIFGRIEEFSANVSILYYCNLFQIYYVERRFSIPNNYTNCGGRGILFC